MINEPGINPVIKGRRMLAWVRWQKRFETSDFAAAFEVSSTAASKTLGRYVAAGVLRRVRTGLYELAK